MKKIHIAIALVLMALPSTAAFAGLNGPTPIPNPPNFFITSSLASVCKGQINNIPITVLNAGGSSTVGAANISGATMFNVELSVTNAKSVFAIKNSTISAGAINVTHTNTVNVPVFVSANASTIVPMEFNINYYFYSIYSDSESRNLTFGTKVCPQPLSVAITPGSVSAGVIDNVTLNFTNSGKTPLNSINAYVSLPTADASWLGTLPVSVPSVPAGQSVLIPARMYVYRNASQSFYANITSTFYNGTSLGQYTVSQSLLSSGAISLTPSSFTISPTTPMPGSTFSISFVLTNIGTSTAGAVTVSPEALSGFSAFGGTNSVFVGDISADSQIPVTVTLVAGNTTKAGSYNIPLKVNYLNGLRQNESVQVSVPVSIGRSAFGFNSVAGANGQFTVSRNGTTYTYRSGTSSGGYVIVIILVIAVVALGTLYVLERKKRRKPSR